MDDFDVIIVGGRVAGASTALLLARAGLRVAVVERAARGRDTLSTHGFMRAGVLQLDRWGLLDAVVAAGTPPIHATVFHYADSDPVRVTIRPSAGVRALYAPRRWLLDEILLTAAERNGAVVIDSVSATGLVRGDDGRVSGVTTASRSGGAGVLRAPLTIGADGVASLVAREAGAETVRRGRSASAVLYGYGPVAAEGYEWGYGAGSAAGLLPTNGGETCVFAATTPEQMRALRRLGRAEAFSAVLRRASPVLAERVQDASAPLVALHGWAGTRGWVRRPFGPGWALVGDAGCFRDPISTHGMTDALRDAEILSAAVVETMSGRVPEAVAMSEYQVLRDRLALRLFDVSDRIAAYDWDGGQLRQLLRAQSSAMSDEVDYLASLPRRDESHLDPVGVQGYRIQGRIAGDDH